MYSTSTVNNCWVKISYFMCIYMLINRIKKTKHDKELCYVSTMKEITKYKK